MKKLSVLIAMILCVTIGGVYATWYYSGADNVADTSEPVTINLEDSQTVGSHGSYTLHKTLNGETFFRIDQADENHTAKLVCKGELVLGFKPAEHASAAIKGGVSTCVAQGIHVSFSERASIRNLRTRCPLAMYSISST